MLLRPTTRHFSPLTTDPAELELRVAIQNLSAPFKRHVRDCPDCDLDSKLCAEGLRLLDAFNRKILNGR